jgi:hypothetical protein
MEGIVKKSFVFLGVVALLAGPAVAQQQPQAAIPLKACISQYADAPGRTPAGLIATGYDIKAAVTGGLWLQKDRDVFYCNSSGRLEEKQSLCWQLREPAAGGLC